MPRIRFVSNAGRRSQRRSHTSRAAGEEAGLPIYERLQGALRERRAPALNFFPLVRQRLADGRVERHRSIVVGEVATSLFEPPGGVAVTRLATPGGIVALPEPKGGGQ